MSISMGATAEGDVVPDMNTTPLIDVMLVLLIMFIITIPVQTHAVKLDLPAPAPPTNAPIDPVFNQVDIDFLSNIYWNKTEVDLRTLKSYMKQAADMPSQPELRLRPEGLAKYSVVDEVMATAQQAGITKMGFVGNEAYAN
ncbi:MAG: ExbD/TolR family protein [Polymorphobacter sp.]